MKSIDLSQVHDEVMSTSNAAIHLINKIKKIEQTHNLNFQDEKNLILGTTKSILEKFENKLAGDWINENNRNDKKTD